MTMIYTRAGDGIIHGHIGDAIAGGVEPSCDERPADKRRREATEANALKRRFSEEQRELMDKQFGVKRAPLQPGDIYDLFKAAKAAGHRIEFLVDEKAGTWIDIDPDWTRDVHRYRVAKPVRELTPITGGASLPDFCAPQARATVSEAA
jgi:hypothetical protein